MKNKLEIYILISVIVVLSSYIIFRKDENINYKIPTLPTVKESEISKISFNNNDLQNTENIWYLPSGYKVSDTSIFRIINQITNLEVIDKISEANNLKPFGLDKPKNLVISNQGKEILNINVGNTSNTGNYTYITIPNNKGVFSVRGDISNLFGSSLDELRSKEVLTVNEALEITITQKSSTIVKKGSESQELLDLLKSVKAANFKELPRKEILLSIAIKDKKDKTLIIFEPIDGEYPATSSDVDFVFTLPQYFVNKLLEFK